MSDGPAVIEAGGKLVIVYVHMHKSCPSVPLGQQPPKFAPVDFSEDGTQTRLRCVACGLELTLTCHTPDNPATPLSKGLPDGAERPNQLHPPG